MFLVVKNPPAGAGDTRDAGSIPGLARSLEKETATHSSIIAWKIPWMEKPGRHSPEDHRELSITAHTRHTNQYFYFDSI